MILSLLLVPSVDKIMIAVLNLKMVLSQKLTWCVNIVSCQNWKAFSLCMATDVIFTPELNPSCPVHTAEYWSDM